MNSLRTTQAPKDAFRLRRFNALIGTSGVIAAILLACLTISGFKRSSKSAGTLQRETEPQETNGETLQPAKNLAVDSIRGFSTFQLGLSRQTLQQRLEPYLALGSYDDPDNHTYRITVLVGAEREWASVPATRVSLQFDSGFVRVVQVSFEKTDFSVFARAFELKYGKPTETSAFSVRWEGEDTRVSMNYSDSYLTIMSATSDRICERSRQERMDQKRKEVDEKARKALERF